MLRAGLTLLLALLASASSMAGEVLVQLPDADARSVVSLHALNQQAPTKLLEKNVVLHQKNRMFDPHLTVIPIGSTVDMTNDDVVYHNVFSFSKAKTFNLGLYPFGGHKNVVFDQAGEVKIFCAVHPQMFAVILVMDTPWFKTINGKTDFRFSNIPAGLYEARLWRKNKPLLSIQKVKIAQTGTLNISFTDKAGATK